MESRVRRWWSAINLPEGPHAFSPVALARHTPIKAREAAACIPAIGDVVCLTVWTRAITTPHAPSGIEDLILAMSRRAMRAKERLFEDIM